ncbi:MAG: RNA polymerase sigma factor [Cyclobacteriaceae bacterium]|nr:RNA polymerase sigma factor [Cyclobacteriaceae bacterium]
MKEFDQLIKECIKEDRKAQKKLYDLFAPRMMMVCLRYSKSMVEAEDILQEAFIKIFGNLKNLREITNLPAWIKRIVINTALNYQRGKLYLYPMADVGKVNLSYGENVAFSHFRQDELLKMIQDLPLGCQVIFNLFAIEGYTHKEIAEKLKISEGTSKSQYSRARILLMHKIGEGSNDNYGKVRK